MSADRYAFFDTTIGPCALVWSEAQAVRAAYFPEATPEATRARLLRRRPDAVEAAPPPVIARAIAGIQALFAGTPLDLADIAIDMPDASDFERRVYDATRAIPPGQLLTYGEVAARIGEPEAAREVGTALGRNPIPIVVPCHRVVGAGGKLVGFSAPGGVETKRKLLAIEQARLGDEPDLFG